MMKNECEAGCKIFTGGEIKHHPGCQYYAESMSKMYDDLHSEVEKLRLQNVTNRALHLKIKQLEARNELLSFMVKNGLDAEDIMNDITYPCEI